MNCPSCGGPTIELFTSRVCKAECDLKVEQLPTSGYYATTTLSFYRPGDRLPVDSHMLPLFGLPNTFLLHVEKGRWTGEYWAYVAGHWQSGRARS